jgi:hypothetical protein
VNLRAIKIKIKEIKFFTQNNCIIIYKNNLKTNFNVIYRF